MNKQILIALGLGLIAVISLLNTEPGKHFVRSVPGTQEALALIHNIRNQPISPEDAGHGLAATEIFFKDPAGIAKDSAGNVFISDRVGFIWKIDTSGTARVIAGTGRRGRSKGGSSATETDLGAPQGIALDSQDRLHIADSFNNVVLRIDNDGTIKRVVGTGYVGHRGDGGPAIESALDEPFTIRFDSNDNLYIAEFGNNWIRKVDQHGIITTVAGTGEPGYSGDGGPATSALLLGPYGAFIDSKDHLYIADSGNNVIRKVDDNGMISTIAGSETRGYAGDGGPATDALLDSPQFLFVADSGIIYIGDEHNLAIRIITPEGTISTLIGEGTRTSQSIQDRGQPNMQSVVLNDPEALLPQSDGSLLIVDGGAARVMRIRADGSIEHYAGQEPATDRSTQNPH
ncbi:MAG: hypothetical protein ACR2QW_15840 [bacterium]